MGKLGRQDAGEESGQAGQHSWVQLPAGRMHYVDAPADRATHKPALLLIHGLLGYGFSWRFNIPELSRHFHVYAPDALGLGLSDRTCRIDCSMAATARRFLQFMDALGIESADVIGTSYGGAIASLMAEQAPARVRRLVLAAPVNPWSRHGLPLIRLLSNSSAALLFGRAAFLLKPLHKYFLRRMYGDPSRISPGTLEGYEMPIEIPGTLRTLLAIVRSWEEDMGQLRRTYERMGDRRILLLWGERDGAVLPESAHELQKRMSQSELVVLPTLGHLPYEESPGEFHRVVMEWLGQRREGD